MRHTLTFLLMVLCAMSVGVAVEFFAPSSGAGEAHLGAAGRLAYWDCYLYGCEEVEEEEEDAPFYYQEEPLDPRVEQYLPGEGPLFLDVVYEEKPWYLVVEEEDYPYQYEIHNPDPWYVSSFPGFGQMARHIVPGAQWWSSPPALHPAPPARPVYAQPSCWISAQPATVSYRDTSALRWESFNATYATLGEFGQVSTNGSLTTPPLASERIYTLNVSGQGGNGSCYTRVMVQPPPQPMPTCIISAHPRTIMSGQTANLAWGSKNASSASLSGFGTVATNGGTYVAPTRTTSYSLTVQGAGGRSSICSTTLVVLP